MSVSFLENLMSSPPSMYFAFAVAALLVLSEARPVFANSTPLHVGTTCALRDHDASVVGSGPPVDYEPASYDDARMAIVDVRLNAAGTVVGTTLRRSSGDVVHDDAALNAARATLYSARVSKCRRVASTFVFRAMFSGPDPEPIIDPGS